MKYIFTDCYDTLVIRREHPFQVIRRWSQCVSRLYPAISSDDLFSTRMKLMKELKTEIVGIEPLFERIYALYANTITNKEVFLADLHMLEIRCEESTISVRKKTISFLEKKKKEGCMIICITDYHLKSEDIANILADKSISLIDKVFSSASYGQTKKDGGLYQTVINCMEINPKDCLMIGDNKVSDIRRARENHFKTRYYSNSFHKWLLRAKNKLGFSDISVRTIGKEIWKKSDTYNEFAFVFYTFCVRLYKEAVRRESNKIVFLAREGFFLRKCFESYQMICIPEDKRLKTEYLKCSRRAIHSVQIDKCLPSFFDDISLVNYFMSIGFSEEESRSMAMELGISNPDVVISGFSDSEVAKRVWEEFDEKIESRIEENKKAFSILVHSVADNGNLLLVDVGWIGRMQQGIDSLFNDITTVGYYIGIYQNLFEPPYIERHGLVFNKSEQGIESYLFHLFRANTQFYEQLLSAPHGSACFYQLDKQGKPIVHEKWDKEEELLYKEVLVDVQKELFSVFEDICTYSFPGVDCSCDSICQFNKELALVMLRSCLVQTKMRLKFMDRLIQGFSQNFQQQSVGMTFVFRNIDGKLSDALIHPDRFVRYVAKLGVILEKRGIWPIGRILMRLYYFYARIVLHV